jgi:hypothetical protein
MLFFLACIFPSDNFQELSNQKVALKKFSVLSTDLADVQYSQIIPFSSAIWSLSFNITPIVIVVYDNKDTMDNVIKMSKLIKIANGVPVLLDATNLYRLGRKSTICQVARLAAWGLKIANEDDLLITADADVWPLSHQIWHPFLSNTDIPFVFNGDYYLSQKISSDDYIAISYVGMSKKMWMDVILKYLRNQDFNLENSLGEKFFYNIIECILKIGRKNNADIWNEKTISKYSSQWSWDQRFLGFAMEYSGITYPISLRLAKGWRRLDRSDWNFNGDFNSYGDMHALFPFLEKNNFLRMCHLWNSIFQNSPHKPFINFLISKMNVSDKGLTCTT